MNNLVVLYDMDSRLAERDHWEERVANYRDANPYYHAWMGDEAAADRLARSHQCQLKFPSQI